MSSFNFFSCSSGIPLYCFSTLHSNDALFSSHIGSLNGSYLFSDCKSKIFLLIGGNNLIEIRWESFLLFNAISYSIELFLVPQLNDVILLIETTLAVFSSCTSTIYPISLTESNIRRMNRFSKMLELFISPGEYLSLTPHIYMKSYSHQSFHDDFKLKFEKCFGCIKYQQNICFSTQNWNELNQQQKITILNLIQALQPFSLIDLPVYIHNFLSEPLRLLSVHLSNSFQFIGLIDSNFQVETLNSILKDLHSQLGKVIQPIYPGPSLTTSAHKCMGVLSINLFTKNYSYFFNPNPIISDALSLKMVLFREFFSFSKSRVYFYQLLSPFNCYGKYCLHTQDCYICYQKTSVYIHYNCNKGNVFLIAKFGVNLTQSINKKINNFVELNDALT